MAFVMHDIKNLASQLSLLSSNAQKHADNPAFRADMLVTLKKSSEKLNALLARLNRYGSGQVQEAAPLDLGQVARDLALRYAAVHRIIVDAPEPVPALGDPEALEQALVHLVQNAIDASEPEMPIHLLARKEGVNGRLDVIDNGCGMTPEFLRAGLFKPFVSSKQGGFGIGAFEAREMIRAMRGRLMVESRKGVGTRFSVLLPMPEAAHMSNRPEKLEPGAASSHSQEVA
jgi:putative PEP-CTERM system histidine kinase